MVAPRLSYEYRDLGTFSRYRSVPGRIRYRPILPRNIEGRVPETLGAAGSHGIETRRPHTRSVFTTMPPSATLFCTPRAAEQTQGTEGSPVCHHGWGSRRWCPQRLIFSFGSGRVACIACGESSALLRIVRALQTSAYHLFGPAGSG